MQTYRIEVSNEFKSWDDTPRVLFVAAATRAAAIKIARREVLYAGYYSSQDGRISYRATKSTAEEARAARDEF
jgi:hypothetical protein